MLINHTNHKSACWSDRQLEAASVFGGAVADVPFPDVDPEATPEEIGNLVLVNVQHICEQHPDAVLCQGEFTYTYRMVAELKARGIKVLAACSKRVTVETINEDQSTRRESRFEFVQFREYR